MFSYYHEMRGKTFSIIYEPHPEWWAMYPDTARQAIETSMSRTLSIIHRFTGRRIMPLGAYFRYAAPTDLSNYERILSTPLHFECSENRLDFDQSLTKVPVASHNLSLYREFRALAERKLAQMRTASSTRTTERIKSMLLSAIDQQLPTVDQAAEQLHPSLD